MNRIRLLPEHVANQIAAGEVVERPASVVKELVENALDAQATCISVEIQAGGRSLIRVVDDGLGMNRDDALLCLERHATSKIQRAEDLFAVATMGFRGEALPSIASISRLILTTREQRGESVAATQVILNAGKIVAVKEAGSPPGTSVEVRQLFFNLPVRRKFLRSEETEYAHIHHYLTLAALAFPEVAFTFIKDARLIWKLPAVIPDRTPTARLAALRERMRALPGAEPEVLPVEFAATLPDANQDESEPGQIHAPEPKAQMRLWGLIGKPGVSRSTREEQYLFVNRRPVENRTLNFALQEAYHTALMKGRYPICSLFLEIDPGVVDVNVHPTKREIKFHNDRAVRQFVAEAVRQTLLAFHAPTSTGPAMAPEQLATPPSPSKTAQPATTKEQKNFSLPSPKTLRPWPKPGPASMPPPGSNRVAASPPALPLPESPTPSLSASAEPAVVPAGESLPLLSVPLRMVGVIRSLYLVLESDRGLVLLDQHAAHERILFEQMLNRLEQSSAPSQRLLLPETVELPVRDAQFLLEQLPVLTRLGVGLSGFGERTFLLDAVPPFVKVGDARRYVLELVDDLKAAGQGVNTLRLSEHTIAKTVCRHAVKANDPLTGPELENLVNDLRHCAMPYTCPHGRPTLIEMNFRELEKKFGRQQ